MQAATDQLKFRVFEEELIAPLKGHKLTALESYVANLLLGATKERPLDNESIRISAGLRFDKVINDRTVKLVIEDLRRDHHFPIIASKGKKKTKERPAQRPGYWWAGSADELKEWYRRVRGESVKLLQTIERIWDSNYPALAGQLKLEDAPPG
ncbi:MAG: hypothetical protein AABN33_18245 [Acidobacteriota bacterium]